MSEPGEPTNLVLEHLRGIREELQRANERLDGMDGRLNTMDGRLDTIDGRLDTVDGRLSRVEQRVERIEADHGGALTKLIDAVTELAKTSAKHTDILIEHSKKLEVIQGTQIVIEKDMRAIRGRIERIEDRFELVKA